MQLCHTLKPGSLFWSRFFTCPGALWFTFCMLDNGPHGGDSQSLLGRSSRSLLIAAWHPAGCDKSKSSFVHLSALRPAPLALVVSCEVGSQKTPKRSMCFSLLCTSIAMSVLSSLCHLSFSLMSHFPLDGGSGSVGSGAALLSSGCSLPSFQQLL